MSGSSIIKQKGGYQVALNPLITMITSEEETIYKMKTYDITVKAHQSTGIVPVTTYWIGEEDVTSAVLKLRLSPQSPSEYVEDYEAWQTMLFAKEQQAIQALYEFSTIEPTLTKPYQRLLWPVVLATLVLAPIILVALLTR